MKKKTCVIVYSMGFSNIEIKPKSEKITPTNSPEPKTTRSGSSPSIKISYNAIKEQVINGKNKKTK